jgi:RNA polymerase sigma-70 factor (ECF subfamily)
MLGDLDALGQAYDTYAAVVYGMALNITSDSRLAEDVTQAVFLGLWRRPERFDPDQKPLRPWLAERAHHLAMLARREAAATTRRDEQASEDDARVIDIDEALQSVLRTEEVQAALAVLPDDERNAIRLAYFGGKTYREVAIELGAADDIIKARMFSGLRRMADSLGTEVARSDPIHGP